MEDDVSKMIEHKYVGKLIDTINNLDTEETKEFCHEFDDDIIKMKNIQFDDKKYPISEIMSPQLLELFMSILYNIKLNNRIYCILVNNEYSKQMIINILKNYIDVMSYDGNGSYNKGIIYDIDSSLLIQSQIHSFINIMSSIISGIDNDKLNGTLIFFASNDKIDRSLLKENTLTFINIPNCEQTQNENLNPSLQELVEYYVKYIKEYENNAVDDDIYIDDLNSLVL